MKYEAIIRNGEMALIADVHDDACYITTEARFPIQEGSLALDRVELDRLIRILIAARLELGETKPLPLAVP